MTVKELIAELEHQPPENDVVFRINGSAKSVDFVDTAFRDDDDDLYDEPPDFPTIAVTVLHR